jgi:hypothetical protein
MQGRTYQVRDQVHTFIADTSRGWNTDLLSCQQECIRGRLAIGYILANNLHSHSMFHPKLERQSELGGSRTGYACVLRLVLSCSVALGGSYLGVVHSKIGVRMAGGGCSPAAPPCLEQAEAC